MNMVDIAIESLEIHIKYDKNALHTGTVNISMAEAENILKVLKEYRGLIETQNHDANLLG